MQYRNLGASGVKVSTLCLGTMTFGEPDEKSFMHKVAADEETSFAVMNRALEAGINFFDTADVYGNDGLTERVLGKWFARDRRRDEIVLASKFRFRMREGQNGAGASRLRILRACEESLRRLATDRIDLYQIHMQDIDTPEDETLRALDDLVRAGKVLYVGCSNYAAYRLADARWISRTKGYVPYVTAQMQYSLIVRDIEREHVPLCQAHGIGLLPWSPLGAGFLSGKFQKDQPPPPGTRLEKFSERLKSFDTPRHWRILDALTAVAREAGRTPSQVALAWLLHKPMVTSVVLGARSVAQLDDNLGAADLTLDAQAMKRLDDASAFEIGYPYNFIANIQKRW
jgi:aryl-alcohol dehydrogenase-like predicted oxidoreductase